MSEGVRAEQFEGGLESKEVREACLAMLDGVRSFNVQEILKMDPKEVRDVILGNPAFSMENYQTLKTSEYLKKFIGHDLGNYAGVILGRRDLLTMNKDGASVRNSIEIILSNWPTYSLIMEDICLRGLDRHHVDKRFYRDFSISELDVVLNQTRKKIEEKLELKKYRFENKDKLAKSPASHVVSGQGRVDVSGLLEQLSVATGGVMELEPGEKLIGVPGVIVNGVCNAIRNAAGEYTTPIIDKDGNTAGEEENGAKNVVVEQLILRDEKGQKYMVFRIIDDGRGMAAEYLQPGSNKFIFAEGRSHRFSSGYGLTNMPSRLESTEAKVRVWTYERDKEDARPAFYPETVEGVTKGDRQAEIDKERDDLEQQYGFRPSTVFDVWGPKIVQIEE